MNCINMSCQHALIQAGSYALHAAPDIIVAAAVAKPALLLPEQAAAQNAKTCLFHPPQDAHRTCDHRAKAPHLSPFQQAYMFCI